MIAVVDRIVDGKIIVLAEKEGKEYVIDQENLDVDLNEGDWVHLHFLQDGSVKITRDHQTSQLTRQRIKDKHQKLKKRKGSRFKK